LIPIIGANGACGSDRGDDNSERITLQKRRRRDAGKYS
jgi:hypothetical protein